MVSEWDRKIVGRKGEWIVDRKIVGHEREWIVGREIVGREREWIVGRKIVGERRGSTLGGAMGRNFRGRSVVAIENGVRASGVAGDEGRGKINRKTAMNLKFRLLHPLLAGNELTSTRPLWGLPPRHFVHLSRRTLRP